jgi:uncharacterized membrane protein HdeD (DUF308 family)
MANRLEEAMAQYTPPALDSERGEYSPLRYWYLLAATGAFGLAVGVLVLSNPSRSLKTLAVILGIYLLLIGVLVIVRTASDEDRGAGGIVLGVVTLIAGVILVRHPAQSIVLISMSLGIYFLVAGALALARVIIGPRRLAALIRGVVLVAAGVLITSSPEISVKTLALFTGIALCAEGVLQVVEALMLRSAYRENTP